MPREEPVISAGHRWDQSEIWEFMEASGKEITPLLRAAAEMRDFGHGSRITFSKNAFIPLTHLCRNVCHYCTSPIGRLTAVPHSLVLNRGLK